MISARKKVENWFLGIFAPHEVIFFYFFFSLIISSLRIWELIEYDFACDFLRFCHYRVMKIEKDLSHIANAVALANASNNAVAPQFADLLASLQEEKLAEEFTLEHGTQHASKEDIEQEFVSLDAVESDKDDIDENDEEQVDMDCVSGSFADLFDTIES